MSIFQGKKYLTRSELRRALANASPSIPGSSRMFSRQERMALEKKVFSKKWGPDITKIEFKKVLLGLRGEKFRAKTSTDKIDIGRQKRYLKKLL